MARTKYLKRMRVRIYGQGLSPADISERLTLQPSHTNIHQERGMWVVVFSYTAAILVATTVLSGCRKTDPIIGEYSSVGSGRPDGGWTVRLFASGECEVQGPIRSVGTYETNNSGYRLETRLRSGLFTSTKSVTMLVSVKTNGTEYLLDATAYKRFARNGDTNLLRHELRRMR